MHQLLNQLKRRAPDADLAAEWMIQDRDQKTMRPMYGSTHIEPSMPNDVDLGKRRKPSSRSDEGVYIRPKAQMDRWKC